MTKLRVHELAKKLGVDNKDILSTLAELGIKGKTHSSAIEPEITEKVEKLLKKKPVAAAKTKKAGAKPEKKKSVEEKRPKRKKSGKKPVKATKPGEKDSPGS